MKIKDLYLNENILDFYNEIQQYFNDVTEAFLKKNDKLAFYVWISKEKYFKKANELMQGLNHKDQEQIKHIMRIAQNIKDMAALI